MNDSVMIRAQAESDSALRRRDRLQSLKHSTVEACFSVPMLNLTMPNLPFVIAFAVIGLGWSPGWIGLMAALPQIANAIQPVLISWLQRRHSLRDIMRTSFVVSAVPWLCVPLLQWFPDIRTPAMAVVITLTTVANSVASVAWSASIAELVPARISGKYFARRNLIFGFWTLLAVLAAGAVADSQEKGFSAFAWILFAAGIGRLLGLSFLNRMKFPRAVEEVHPAGTSLQQTGNVLRDGNYLRFMAFIGCWGFFLSLSLPFQTVFLINVLHIPMREIMFLTTAAGIGGLMTLKGWGALCDRYGNKPVLQVSAMAWGAVGLVAWLLASPEWKAHLLVAYLVIGSLTAGFQLCQFNLMLKLVTAQKKSAHIAVFLATTSLLAAVGPALGGVIMAVLPRELGDLYGQQFLNYHAVFAVSMLGCLLSPLILRGVREDAEAPAMEVWRAMRAMKAFNPLLGVATAAEFIFTPRGLTGLARHSWRSIRRQARSIGEVGVEITSLGQRTPKSPAPVAKH